MSHESNWLQSTKKLCSVKFINPADTKGTGIRAVTFFDISNWTDEDIYQSKGAADGAVFLFRPATDENLGLTSLFIDLEKYALGFRHVIDQVCYRFKWTCSTTSRDPMSDLFLGDNNLFCNYANLPANKPLLCILKHLMLLSEKAELSGQDCCFLKAWDMIGLLSGLENFADEVPVYATLLTTIVVYNVNQEIRAMRESSKNAHQLLSSPEQQAAAAAAAADSLNYSAALEFATQMAKEVINEGTFEASIKLMESSSGDPQSIPSSQNKDQVMKTDPHKEKADDMEGQGKVSPAHFQVIEGTSQPGKLEEEHQSLSLSPSFRNQQEGSSKSTKSYINALMVEDIWSPTIKENWMDQETEFKMTFAEYAYLLRLGLIEYIKQFASDLVDSILNSLVYGDTDEEEKHEDPFLKSEFSKEEDLARFFLMLYANRLRGQIVRAMLLFSQRGQICNEIPWKLIAKAGENMETPGTAKNPESSNIINKENINVDDSDRDAQETATLEQNTSVNVDSQVPSAAQPGQAGEHLHQVLPNQAGRFSTSSTKLPSPTSRKGDILDCIQKLRQYVVKEILCKSDSKCWQALSKEIETNLPFPVSDPDTEIKRSNLSRSSGEPPSGSTSGPENVANQIVPTGIQELIDCLKEAGSMCAETGEYKCSVDTEMRRGWSIKIIAATSAQETPDVLAINLTPSDRKNAQQLQAVLQWAAASQIGIPTLHFREEDAEVLAQLPLVIQKTTEKEITVGTLLQALLRYWKEQQMTPRQENVTPILVLEWLLENL